MRSHVWYDRKDRQRAKETGEALMTVHTTEGHGRGFRELQGCCDPELASGLFLFAVKARHGNVHQAFYEVFGTDDGRGDPYV